MFGALLFATVPFATVGGDFEIPFQVWRDFCPASSDWGSQAVAVSPWAPEAAADTNWDNEAPNRIPSTHCTKRT